MQKNVSVVAGDIREAFYEAAHKVSKMRGVIRIDGCDWKEKPYVFPI